MNYGLCLCTTVLTVVSGVATGRGVRLIHSRYTQKKRILEMKYYDV